MTVGALYLHANGAYVRRQQAGKSQLFAFFGRERRPLIQER